MIRARARAKVNLCLEVLGGRPDGYHEVATVLQAISLCDELALEPAEGLSLLCDDPALAGPDNLALRAAEELRREAGVRRGARIALSKRIPVAAGLGGGSADAAAVLLALDRLWGTRLALQDLLRLGARLGSDVCFFLGGSGTALAEGRGERVTPLRPPSPAWVLVLVPPVSAPERKTAALYEMLGSAHFTEGSLARRWASGLERAAPWPALLADPAPFNVFEAVALGAYPGIQGPWRALQEAAGVQRTLLAGSGPALYALFEGRAEAEGVRDLLVSQGYRVLLAETATQPVDLEG